MNSRQFGLYSRAASYPANVAQTGATWPEQGHDRRAGQGGGLSGISGMGRLRRTLADIRTQLSKRAAERATPRTWLRDKEVAGSNPVTPDAAVRGRVLGGLRRLRRGPTA